MKKAVVDTLINIAISGAVGLMLFATSKNATLATSLAMSMYWYFCLKDDITELKNKSKNGL